MINKSKIKSGSNLIFKSVFILSICNFLSRLFGFIRDVILSSKYGTSEVSDAYYLSNTMITVIFFAITFAVSTAYLPIYAKASKVNTETGKKFHNTIFTVSLTLSLALSILVILFAKPLVNIFGNGFNEHAFDITVSLVRYMAFSIFFNCFIQLLASYLQYKELFLVAGMNGAILNLSYIVGVYLSGNGNIKILGLSFTVAHVLVFLLLFLYSKKHKFKFNFSFKDKSGFMRESWALTYPLLIGNISSQINESIDKALASNLETGVISALNYANKIQGFIIGVMVSSIITVIFPKLTRDYADKNYNGIREKINYTSQNISAVSLPVSIGLILFAKEIISAVFMRGNFNEKSLIITSTALIGYTLGLPFYSLRDLYVRTLYAMQNTKKPIIIDAIGVAINIALNLLLIQRFSYIGLVISSSISNLIRLVLLAILLNKKLSGIFNKSSVLEYIKIIIASVIMGIIIFVIKLKIPSYIYSSTIVQVIYLVIFALVALIIYTIILAILNSKVYIDSKRFIIKYISRH